MRAARPSPAGQHPPILPQRWGDLPGGDQVGWQSGVVRPPAAGWELPGPEGQTSHPFPGGCWTRALGRPGIPGEGKPHFQGGGAAPSQALSFLLPAGDGARQHCPLDFFLLPS